MHRFHRSNVNHVLILAILLSLVAPAAQARVQTPEPLPEAQDVDASQGWSAETRIISEGEITNMAILSVEPEEIVMEWQTATGCTFDLAFHPQGEIDVVAGDTGRCRFDTWLAGATESIDPSLVESVWESPSWWDVFSSLANGGSGAPPDPDSHDMPNAEDYTEIEEASECGKAAAVAAFTMLGCFGTAGVALSVTGASGGVFAGSFVAVVSVCGLAAVAGIDALDKCESQTDYREFALEELLDYSAALQDLNFQDYAEVEDLYTQYTEIEELDYDFSLQEDAVELTNRCLDIVEDLDDSINW